MVGAVEIRVSTTAPAVRTALNDLARRQLPFATAVALTRVAVDSREEVARRLPHHFTIRGPRVARGVQVDPARKTDWPNPAARVGTRDEFMALHVMGGVKRAQRGATHVAVPTRLIKRTATGAVPARLKPRPLRSRDDVFLEDRRIRRRFGARARLDVPVRNLGGVGTYFTLVREARIRPTWPMPTEVERVVGSTYEDHFHRELTAAVRSARVRAGSFTSEQGRAAYLAKRTEAGRLTTYRRMRP